MASTKLSLISLVAASSCLIWAGSAPAQPEGRKINLNNRYFGVDLELQSCTRKGIQIQCSLTMTSTQPGAITYSYTRPLTTSKITDDEHIDHAQANGYFVVGKGRPADHVTLVRGDKIDIVQIFNGADPEVKHINLIFGDMYFSTDLD